MRKRRGAPLPGSTSALSSTSRYLNSPALRNWCATEMLRKNGADLPPPAGVYELVQIHQSLITAEDRAHVEGLFIEERKKNPILDAWFNSNPQIPVYTKADLAQYPPSSVGGLLLDYVVRNNFELELHPPFEPRDHYDVFGLISARRHDLDHILTGAGFDYMAELVPYYLNLSQAWRFFSPELAGYIAEIHMFGSLRYTVRTMLHYPRAWPAAMQSMLRGIRVGMASEPFYTFDYESVFGMTVEDARKTLGVREAVDIDTSEISWLWGDASHRALRAVATGQQAG